MNEHCDLLMIILLPAIISTSDMAMELNGLELNRLVVSKY